MLGRTRLPPVANQQTSPSFLPSNQIYRMTAISALRRDSAICYAILHTNKSGIIALAKENVVRTMQVYEQLRSQIISGKIRPNEALIEDDLAVAFEVSRTPVRESFQRLYRDGLIVPRKRGWQVKEFSRAEVQESYEVRAELEGLAARLAAVRGSPQKKAAIQRIHRDRLSVNLSSIVERVNSNRELHEAILEAAQNGQLAKQISITQNFYYSLRTANQMSQENYERSHIEHEEIIAAIMAGDGDRAHNAMRAHILRAMTVWLETTDAL